MSGTSIGNFKSLTNPNKSYARQCGYRRINLEDLIRKHLLAENPDIRAFGACLSKQLDLAAIECASIKEHLAKEMARSATLERELHEAKEKSKKETHSLVLRRAMEDVEKIAKQHLGIDSREIISRQDLWWKYFVDCPKFRGAFKPFGLRKAKTISAMAEEIYSTLSGNIHKYPYPERFALLATEQFNEDQLNFLQAVCELAGIALVEQTIL